MYCFLLHTHTQTCIFVVNLMANGQKLTRILSAGSKQTSREKHMAPGLNIGTRNPDIKTRRKGFPLRIELRRSMAWKQQTSFRGLSSYFTFIKYWNLFILRGIWIFKASWLYLYAAIADKMDTVEEKDRNGYFRFGKILPGMQASGKLSSLSNKSSYFRIKHTGCRLYDGTLILQCYVVNFWHLEWLSFADTFGSKEMFAWTCQMISSLNKKAKWAHDVCCVMTRHPGDLIDVLPSRWHPY